MSEFKFACPMCGQHIRCDSEKSGRQVDCPTCFQKLIVPDAPQGDVSKLVLNAALANARRYKPSDTTSHATVTTRSSARGFPVGIVALAVLTCAAGGTLYAFRGNMFNRPIQTVTASSSSSPSSLSVPASAGDAGWILDLTGVTIPDTPISGRINGRAFNPQRVAFQSDTLNFRQGANRPPDLGLMIVFFVKGGWELAAKSISITTNDHHAPTVLLRWKDDHGQSVSQYYKHGYVLRLDFDTLSGNRLMGKVYFCAPDEAKSYVAGRFDAEILKPPKARPKVARRRAAR